MEVTPFHATLVTRESNQTPRLLRSGDASRFRALQSHLEKRDCCFQQSSRNQLKHIWVAFFCDAKPCPLRCGSTSSAVLSATPSPSPPGLFVSAEPPSQGGEEYVTSNTSSSLPWLSVMWTHTESGSPSPSGAPLNDF